MSGHTELYSIAALTSLNISYALQEYCALCTVYYAKSIQHATHLSSALSNPEESVLEVEI